MAAVVVTLERDLAAGAAYPGWLLEGCETALILFCAGFLGKQDCVWIAEAGLRATCVDEDQEKLDAMRGLYPETWEFVCRDVYEYARELYVGGLKNFRRHRQWDIVSLDPWTQDFDRCAANLDVWRSLARRAIVLGTGVNTHVEPPEDWAVTEVRKRSDYDGGVYWSILEPA